jgi:hypothetical protein
MDWYGMDEHLGRKGPHISRCLSLLRNRGLLHGTFQEDGVQVGWSYHVLPPMPFHTHTAFVRFVQTWARLKMCHSKRINDGGSYKVNPPVTLTNGKT